MPTYNPQITISAAPGITGYLRLALFEATAPNTEVAASAQLAPPHNASRQLQFTGLNPVIHLAKLYVTDGISSTGTIVANFSLDPRFPGVELKAPLFIYADTQDGFDSGTTQFTDPDGLLEGWDYEVEDRGFGTFDPDSEIDQTGPGYQILIEDYSLQPGQLHIIRFAPKLITYAVGANTGGVLFSSVELVTANRTLVAADTGKQLMIASATSTITLTLPEIDSVIAGKLFMITSQGGSHKNVKILVDGSDSEKIDWLFGENTQIMLGQSEHIWLYKWVNPDDNTDRRWKVMHASDGIGRVGEIFYYNQYDTPYLLNSIFANGQLLDRDVYPRLWAFVQSLDATQLISDATWSTGTENKGRYSTGDGSTTFRVPLLHSTGFMRGVDGSTRKAGSYEASQVGSFEADITLPKAHAYTGGPNNTRIGNGFNGLQDVIHENINVDTGNTETLPPNTGAYLCIRI